MLKIKIIGALFCTSGMAFGQTTADQAVAAALQNHPQAKAAALQTQAKNQAERAARAFDNPEINAESPTGEFYTVGVLQNFDFPTVYKNRRRVAQAESGLAAAEQKLSENELRQAVRTLFLETQIADFQLVFEKRRDSIFQKIAEAAARQLAAGEIDFLQKTLAVNESDAAQQRFLATQNLTKNLRTQLQIWTGIEDLNAIEPLRPDRADVADFSQNPSILLEKQAATVAERQADLKKSENLPNFSIGYLNQGAQQTPIDLRFRASVGVPIWVGQNRAARESAQLAALAAQHRAAAAAQTLAAETAAAQNEEATALAQVEYFERRALPRSRVLVETAERLRAAGQIDYQTFLRTLDEAFSIENEYVASVRALNLAQIRLRFLAGN